MANVDPAASAFGKDKFIGGNFDPRLVAVLADRGTVYVLSRTTGAILLLQKNDDGKTTNWVEIAAAIAIHWAASILLDKTKNGVNDIYTVRTGERIVAVKAFVEIAFDGGAPTLKVGIDSGANDKYMTAVKNNLKAINTYSTNFLDLPSVGDKVQATLDIDGSNAGQAIVAVQKLIITGAK